ncbi:FHA domain-containing protein [Mycena sanguinolenta]|uniref:FHA domain-containing protein n=1 Tax=Mycena sanguinolenta TaxID=230812 RepID=A0A8H6YUF2_9AGAR|nr:FHA domain-containing protein [Mycena sanguinolenta]
MPAAILHLSPLDPDASFIPKRLGLPGGSAPNARVKIARPPNTKTHPGERNGYFESRVLSRQHAEVWEEGGRIWIKDVKSSNGTFINGERLSLEGRESEPNELKSDDILEFGVDIVAEDNKTVLHRKVVARVACVFPSVSSSSSSFSSFSSSSPTSFSSNSASSNSGLSPSALPGDQFATISATASAPFGANMLRRPQPQLPGGLPIPNIHHNSGLNNMGMGGMGGLSGAAAATRRALTLDHIFTRLQAELAKSRETGRDLLVLTGALSGVEETLGGGGPPHPLPDVHALPPVRPPPPQRAMSVPALSSPSLASASSSQPSPTDLKETQLTALADLKVQQDALRAEVEAFRKLAKTMERVLEEQEVVVAEARRRGPTKSSARKESPGEMQEAGEHGVEAADDERTRETETAKEQEEEEEEGDDDDDARSVMTVVPHELEAVVELDEGEFEDVTLESPLDSSPPFPLDSAPDEEVLREAQEAEAQREAEAEAGDGTPEPSLDEEGQSPSPPGSHILPAAAAATIPSPPPPLQPAPPPFVTSTSPSPAEGAATVSSPPPPQLAPPPTSPTQRMQTAAAATTATLTAAELTARLALLSVQLEAALERIAELEAERASVLVSAGEGDGEAEAQTVVVGETPAEAQKPRQQRQQQQPHPPPDLSALQAQLDAMRAELAREREARASFLRDEQQQQLGNGHLENGEKDVGLRHRDRREGAAHHSEEDVDTGMHAEEDGDEEGMDDSMRLERLELGDLRHPASNVGVQKSQTNPLMKTYPNGQQYRSQLNAQTAVGLLVLGAAAAAVVWRVRP